MTGRFSGKVAIVTGASQQPSIGRATAERLAREGASLVINARGEEPLRAAEQELRDAGFEVVAVAGSTEDDDTLARLVAVALERYGGVDAVVHTVGGSPFRGTPRTLGRAELMRTVELNTWGAVGLVQRALGAGLAERRGAVVHISSGTVHKTTPSMIAYTAAKAALNAITRTLARDLAPLGVRVNAVAPGLTQTSGTRELWELDGGAAAARNLPLGRLTRAEDIASACAFLLSDDARQITGQILDVDGGNHLLGGWSPIVGSD